MVQIDPRRELYRLWFEFLKRAVEARQPIDANYYREWLPIEGLTFNQWWTGFRKHLTTPSVAAVVTSTSVPADSILLAVSRSANKAIALKQIKAILDAELDGKVRHTYGDYAPTAGSNIKYAAFRLMLHCYDSESKTDGKGRKASRVDRVKRVIDRYEVIEKKYGSTQRRIDRIPKALDASKGDGIGADDLLRNYYRSVQKAKRIIANVARGEFPGKYT